MPIDLRLLRHAHALAEHRSFSRAAAALKIAQPSLSRGIQELEARVGLPLFLRSRSGPEPTDFGRVFLQHAASVLALVDDLEREVALATELGTGEVAVALGPYVADTIGPICAARFSVAHPGVRLRTLLNDPVAVVRHLRARTVDLGVAESSVLEDDDAVEIIAGLAPLPAYVVVRAGHPLADLPGLRMADLMRYPFAPVTMLTPRALKPMLAARRAPSGPDAPPLPPFPAIECPTIRFAAGVVANSDAFTLATLGMVRAELERGELVAVHQEPWIHTEWGVARLRGRRMSPGMLSLVEELKRAHAEVLRAEALLREQWAKSRSVVATPAKPARRSPSNPRRRSRIVAVR